MPPENTAPAPLAQPAPGSIAAARRPLPEPPEAALPVLVWLLDSLRLGGAERLALAFAQEYIHRGGQVRLVSMSAAPGAEQALESEALRLRLDWTCLHARHLRDRAAWRRLRSILDTSRPAVLHAHLRYATLWGALAAWRRRPPLPLVVTLHILPQRERLRRRTLARLERWALNHIASRVLVLGPAQAAAWTRAGLDPRRLLELPNGVCRDTPALDARARLRAALDIPLEAPVFLTVAAVRVDKGWRDWLEVQSCLSQRTEPPPHFIWLGAGPEAELLRRAAQGRTGVHLPGLQLNVADWLAAADVFLFPSHQEAMPTALAEALAAGLPAAAYALPPNREVAARYGAVHWAPLGDSAALAQAAIAALSSPHPAGATAAFPPETDVAAWVTRLTALYRHLAPVPRPAPHRLRIPTPRRHSRARHADPPARQTPSILIIEFFSRGGLFHYSLQLAMALARQGAAVTLLTGRKPELVPPPLPGLRFAPVLPTWNPRQPGRGAWRLALRRFLHGLCYARAWWHALRWVRWHRPDWVLLGDLEHRCDAWAVAWLRRRGVAIADICHNPAMFDRRLWRGMHRQQTGELPDSGPQKSAPSAAGWGPRAVGAPLPRDPRPLTRHAAWRQRALSRFNVTFVHAVALAAQVAQFTRHPPVVIPHGNESLFLAAETPGPDWRHRWGWPAGRRAALLFGTLTEYKGLPTLIAALAAIPPSARPGVVVAGFPAADVDPRRWRQLATAHGLDAWLRWELTYIPSPQVAGLFRAVDFVVLPYWEASQSGVAHLALTFSRPVIATTTGGLPEVIHSEENGLLVPPRDAAALAGALERMTTSAALLQRLSAGAAASCRAHDWGAIAARMRGHFLACGAATTPAGHANPAGCPAATATASVPPAPN